MKSDRTPTKSVASRCSVMPAFAAMLILLPSTGAVARSGEERWSATSRTAMGITGDIVLSPTRLTAARKTFPLAVVADVKTFGTAQGPQAARILRVTKPANPILLNGNRLCGTSPVRWIAVYRSEAGQMLNLAAFSGARRPNGENDPGLCSTFLYAR